MLNFETLSCMSDNLCRHTKATGDAELLAACEAIDEGKVLQAMFEVLVYITIKLNIVVDSKDLSTSLSTQSNSVNGYIRADINFKRLDIRTKKICRKVWIPGKTILAASGMKTDNPLILPLN